MAALALSVFLFAAPALAQPGLLYWSEIAPDAIDVIGERGIEPLEYRTLALDFEAMQAYLLTAPLETVPGRVSDGILVALPLPDGAFATYRLIESPVMAAGLQARFPSIRTYVGADIDVPSATVRLSVTPQGFHAQSFRPEGTFYIEPFTQHDLRHVRVYWRDDLPPRDPALYPPDEVFELDGLGEHFDQLLEQTQDAGTRFIHGDELRIYRTAVAARANFTIYHSASSTNPTVEEGLAAVVTVMNRVNQIYERDLAVRMVLVDNNDEIIYTSSSDEPYSGNDNVVLMNQNHANLNSVIGSANYDIGHLLVRFPGGGVAILYSACNNLHKGRAVSGSPNPAGDPYVIDVVSHEFGHQFGARHTFNSNFGGCGANRTGVTAYEPGSGSTIMAYSGLCGDHNIQNSADATFHNISLTEMTLFLDGTGGTCGQVVETENAIPDPILPQAYQLPILTGFRLPGGAEFDGDEEMLTYAWDGFDLGPGGPPPGRTGWNHTSPFFRSYVPSVSATRFFPRIDRFVPGLTTLGEGLPNASRMMRFRLTVRGNQPGAGSLRDRQLNLLVDGDAGPFIVTSQGSAQTLTGGQQVTVTWDVAGTDDTAFGGEHVDVLLSLVRHVDILNGTYVTLAEAVPNNGAATVTIPPGLSATHARIFVRANPGHFYHFNAGDLTIVPISTEETAQKLTADLSPVYPNPVGVAGGRATINLSVDRAQTVEVAVFDALGRRVSVLHAGPVAAEVNHQFALSARDLPSGTYYVRAVGESFSLVRPMTVVH